MGQWDEFKGFGEWGEDCSCINSYEVPQQQEMEQMLDLSCDVI